MIWGWPKEIMERHGIQERWQLEIRVKLQKLSHQRQIPMVLQLVHDSKFIFLYVFEG